MQLCLQNGLHMHSKRQDFSQAFLVKDANQEMSRARLWAWFKVVCPCVNIYCGLPPHLFDDSWVQELHWGDEFVSGDLSIYWMQRLETVMTSSLNTLTSARYDGEHGDPANPLTAIIKHFDDEVIKLKKQSHPHLAAIWFLCTRLHLGAYHFFISRSNSNLTHLIEVYHQACAFVDIVETRDQQDDYALYISEQYYRTLMLGAITILRVCRSTELAANVDLLMGERSYFAAIRILKKRVLRNNDLNAQMATILSQLWQSQRVFRQPGGSLDSLTVRIRSRGEMGIVYDCLWHWRQELRGELNPYQEECSRGPDGSNSVASLTFDGTIHPSLGQNTTTTQTFPELDENSFPNMIDDDGFFSEWNWSMDNLFVPPAIQQHLNDMESGV
ncbi:uncharacterized protein A1O5_08632 [Cladophialophora psammophila CBS 110553]|uniref:Transcription factor domain-containing protein n=1 Tax=Cladophialophora psammophila CBS 110553 TaxID=1182543 RepID=W9WIQ0_9EURO|nr:uncharacterized protein A1O5_08632 [Cladophialophora psammophila CBS 110553]EXJ68017.1 hypothetical protein A1O5_08632 [Cladophialophora psammophila CBS 110553]